MGKWDLASGKLLHNELERSSICSWVNPLFRLGYVPVRFCMAIPGREHMGTSSQPPTSKSPWWKIPRSKDLEDLDFFTGLSTYYYGCFLEYTIFTISTYQYTIYSICLKDLRYSTCSFSMPIHCQSARGPLQKMTKILCWRT